MSVSGKRVLQGTIDCIPHLDSLIMRRCIDQTLAAPANTGHIALVARQNMLRLAGVDDPNSHGSIFGSTSQSWGSVSPLVIWLPREICHPLGVPRQWSSNSLSRLGVPDPDCLVHTASRQLGTVWAPRDSQYPARVARQCVFGCTGIAVPDPRRIVARSSC